MLISAHAALRFIERVGPTPNVYGTIMQLIAASQRLGARSVRAMGLPVEVYSGHTYHLAVYEGRPVLFIARGHAIVTVIVLPVERKRREQSIRQ